MDRFLLHPLPHGGGKCVTQHRRPFSLPVPSIGAFYTIFILPSFFPFASLRFALLIAGSCAPVPGRRSSCPSDAGETSAVLHVMAGVGLAATRESARNPFSNCLARAESWSISLSPGNESD